jgi:4-amino-4-deoxy-L-arabinose transferase-like glycosyltransferase
MPWLTYKIGRQVFDDTIAIVAAGISAGYLYFVYYAGTLMTESFYIVSLLASFYFAMRLVQFSGEKKVQTSTPRERAGFLRSKQARFALAFGLALGAAALLRQLSILFIPFLFAWVWWAGSAVKKGSTIPALALTSMVIGVMILPFTIYNFARFDRFVLLNTNAGYAFFWGNHPIYGTKFESILPPEMGTYQDLIPAELYDLDEAALDQELLKRGVQFVIDDPARYALLSLSRIPAYFMFWPSSESGMISNVSRVFSFGVSWPFMLLGLLLVPFSRRANEKLTLHAPQTLLIGFMVVYTLIHLLTWALIRYRLPVDSILILFQAFALTQLAQIFINARQPKKVGG